MKVSCLQKRLLPLYHIWAVSSRISNIGRVERCVTLMKRPSCNSRKTWAFSWTVYVIIQNFSDQPVFRFCIWGAKSEYYAINFRVSWYVLYNSPNCTQHFCQNTKTHVTVFFPWHVRAQNSRIFNLLFSNDFLPYLSEQYTSENLFLLLFCSL